MVATQKLTPPGQDLDDNRPAIIGSLSMGAISTFVFTVVATLVSEESHGFKNFLTDLTGHHWVSKGLLSLLVFLVVSAVAYPTIKRRTNDMVVWGMATAGVAVVGSFVIFFYFVGHFVSEG